MATKNKTPQSNAHAYPEVLSVVVARLRAAGCEVTDERDRVSARRVDALGERPVERRMSICLFKSDYLFHVSRGRKTPIRGYGNFGDGADDTPFKQIPRGALLTVDFFLSDDTDPSAYKVTDFTSRYYQT